MEKEEKIKKGRDENQTKMRSRLDEVRDEIKASKLKFTNRGYNLLDETGCTLRQVRILHLKPISMGRSWPYDISWVSRSYILIVLHTIHLQSPVMIEYVVYDNALKDQTDIICTIGDIALQCRGKTSIVKQKKKNCLAI